MSIDQNTVILVVGGIAVAYILIGIAKTALKAVGLIIVIGLGYYFWQGGTVGELRDLGLEAMFKEKDLTALASRYCAEEKANSLKCECIVTPVQQDLLSRLSEEELKALANDENKRIAEIKISLKNQKKQIQNCIVKQKGAAAWDGLKDAVEKVSQEAQ